MKRFQWTLAWRFDFLPRIVCTLIYLYTCLHQRALSDTFQLGLLAALPRKATGWQQTLRDRAQRASATPYRRQGALPGCQVRA